MAFNKNLLIFYPLCETKNKCKRHRERCIKGKSFLGKVGSSLIWLKIFVKMLVRMSSEAIPIKIVLKSDELERIMVRMLVEDFILTLI